VSSPYEKDNNRRKFWAPALQLDVVADLMRRCPLLLAVYAKWRRGFAIVGTEFSITMCAKKRLRLTYRDEICLAEKTVEFPKHIVRSSGSKLVDRLDTVPRESAASQLDRIGKLRNNHSPTRSEKNAVAAVWLFSPFIFAFERDIMGAPQS